MSLGCEYSLMKSQLLMSLNCTVEGLAFLFPICCIILVLHVNSFELSSSNNESYLATSIESFTCLLDCGFLGRERILGEMLVKMYWTAAFVRRIA